MSQRVFSEDYRITSYLVNLRQRAGLYAILNLVQDVGWQHAVHLGLDLDTKGLGSVEKGHMLRCNHKKFSSDVHLSTPADNFLLERLASATFSTDPLLWVFTRQKLVMQRWPAWNEVISIHTWLRPTGGSPFVLRDYEIWTGKEKIGLCTSSFSVIDAQTRKLANPDWSSFSQVWREDHALDLNPSKIAIEQETKDLASFEVRNSDLDLNNHVNNTKYAQWILDAVPLPELKKVQLHEYEINFLAETKKGDHIMIRQSHTPEPYAHFQGWRASDKKIVFTARLKLERA